MSVGHDPLMNEPSYSVKGFCLAEDISKSTYHKLRDLGYGPEEMRFPDSPMVRITTKARREWHTRMEQLKKDAAEKLAADFAARSATNKKKAERSVKARGMTLKKDRR